MMMKQRNRDDSEIATVETCLVEGLKPTGSDRDSVVVSSRKLALIH